MPWHKNVSTVPVDIGGRMIPPNGWADLEGHVRQVKEHVDAGRLVASDVAPEDLPDDPQEPASAPQAPRVRAGATQTRDDRKDA